MKHLITALFLNPAFFVVLVLGSVVLIALRLFGLLFFLSTTSLWVAAPAVSLLTLLIIAAGAVRPPLLLIALSVALFAASVIFHGWYDLTRRLADGGSGTFEALELAVLCLLVTRALLLRRSK